MTADRRFGRVLWGVNQACGVSQVLRVVAAHNSLATGCRRLELFCTGGRGGTCQLVFQAPKIA